VLCCLEDQKEEFKNGLWAGLKHEIAAYRSDQSGSFRVIGRTEASQVIKRGNNGTRTVVSHSLLYFERFILLSMGWLLY
jgi:hypothetical protein